MYKNNIELRPEWKELRAAVPDEEYTESELQEIKPIERFNMIFTRNKDDEKKLSVEGSKKERPDKIYRTLTNKWR